MEAFKKRPLLTFHELAHAIHEQRSLEVGISDTSTAAYCASLHCIVVIGYADGRLSSKFHVPEAPKRGSFLEDGTRVHQRSKNGSDVITLAGVAVSIAQNNGVRVTA